MKKARYAIRNVSKKDLSKIIRKFDNFEKLDKTKIKSSESKRRLERSGKGLITSLGFKAKVRPTKYKKAR